MDLNILILSFYYYPDLCAGSFRCSALIKHLKAISDNNTTFHVITTLPNRYSSFNIDAPEIEQNARLTIHRIKLPQHQSGMLDQTKAFIHFTHKTLKLVRSKHYDLVFATSSRLMTAVLGSWIAQKKQARLYLDIRDIFVDTIGDVLPAKISIICKPVFSIIEKWALGKADRINLVSEGFHPYFASRYPKKSFSSFSNGIDHEFVASHERDTLISSSSKKLTVLYAGNIGEGQGLHHIIPHLANCMKDTVLFKIFGDGGRKAILETKLLESGCGNVELLPPIHRDALIQEYQKADVLFLHLNDYDAFKKVLPSKIFEYAAMGKPIWAGVSGYCASFILCEIPNAAVFPPCNYIAALEVFNNLSFEKNIRSDFIKKYARQVIMEKMAADILNLAKHDRFYLNE